MSNEVSRQVRIETKFDQRLMIKAITCSMLEYPYISDYDEMGSGVFKSTLLEPTIIHLMKGKSLASRFKKNW